MSYSGLEVMNNSSDSEDNSLSERQKTKNISDIPGKQYKLEAESELRIEVRDTDSAAVVLMQGRAEIFGCEMVKEKIVRMKKMTTCAIFTWHGCSIKVMPESVYAYVSDKTPMQFYINLHEALEQRRCKAEKDGTDGPVSIIIGPTDVGKSTLCRLLVNYAIRLGRTPTYVDLDVGQGGISIPGSIGAVHINKTVKISQGLNNNAAIVFHHGSNTPSTNVKLYETLVSRLADCIRQYWQNQPSKRCNGCIVNTCGWITDTGYKLLIYAAEAFNVGQIIVLDNERLYNDLKIHFKSNMEIVLAPKSGGVIERVQQVRANARSRRVRAYFYGDSGSGYTPHVYELSFAKIEIYKIGGPNLPNSCLPLGMATEDTALKPVKVVPDKGLVHRILAVSAAMSADDDIIRACVIGFVCVYDVDLNGQILKVLSPSPGPLPRNILIQSDISFYDTHT